MIRNKFNVFQKHTKIFVKVDIANMAGILKYFAGAKPEGDNEQSFQEHENWKKLLKYAKEE